MMDEVERRIRAARPLSGNRYQPLSDRAKRELADLLLSNPDRRSAIRRPRRPANRRRGGQLLRIVGSAAAALVVLGTVMISVLHQTPAVAMTPPLLETTSVDETVPALLEDLEQKRRDVELPSGNTIRAQTWSLNTTVDAKGNITSSTVEPQWNETMFEKDGSVRSLVVAADPFPGEDTEGLTKTGTVLADESYARGEYASPFAEPVPTDPALIGSYLARAAGKDSLTAGETIIEISGLLSNVPLDKGQEIAILSYLRTVRGLTVAGAVTDRLGRVGVALKATDREPGELEDLLIISTETGAIIASETIYIGSDRTDIRSLSVIDYTVWER
ncbi:hypothetical protein [Luethyella okanaganae]|uniref:Uncharacterized protein n=1 Tax=Luethyella okanaganae TaxID=69372 RepID=A0ABW1VBH8_9MICO